MIAIRAAATQLNQSQVEELWSRRLNRRGRNARKSERAEQKAITENGREAGPRGHVVVWVREAATS